MTQARTSTKAGNSSAPAAMPAAGAGVQLEQSIGGDRTRDEALASLFNAHSVPVVPVVPAEPTRSGRSYTWSAGPTFVVVTPLFNVVVDGTYRVATFGDLVTVDAAAAQRGLDNGSIVPVE